MLNVDLLDSVDNLNLDEIAPSIMSYPYWDAYGNKIILLVLELLKLYDKKRNDDILHTAAASGRWCGGPAAAVRSE